jgi:TetR/AcrR family transcriptional regulator, transcriptional repressor for nem operon
MDKTPKREQTRARILAGAGRTFRSNGYGAAGVDALATAAGVTSGAFYSHFGSKADAFRESVQQGMQELQGGIRHFREQAGDNWVAAFVEFYLGERRTCPLTESCALQSLTGEIERADERTRDTFETELNGVVDAAAEGLDAATAKARRQQAIVMLALLSGGVSLARAVNDPAISQEIAAAVRGVLNPAPAKPSRPAKTSRRARAKRT